MFAKKGQLSVETMIIYGLVILVAISVIGILIYFDILDLGAYLPDNCDLGGTGDLKCEEMKFSGNTIQLGIRNIGQKPIESLGVVARDEEGIHFTSSTWDSSTVDGAAIGPTNTLAPGKIAAVTITTVGTTDTGRVLKATLTTTYEYLDGAIEQEYVGSLRLKAS